MLVTLTRNCVLGHDRVGAAGETHDLPPDAARRLVTMGKAVPAAVAPRDTSAREGLTPESAPKFSKSRKRE